MRITYAALHLEKVIMVGGVGQKIAAQIRIWQEKGRAARLFLLSPDEQELTDTSLYHYQPGYHFLPLRILSREEARSRALRRMIDEIRAYQPDVIYLRYGMFALPLQKLYDIAPVVVELNGDDVNEYRHRGWFYYWLNRSARPIIMGKAAGLLALSHEISRLPSNTAYKKNMQVIANGIDTNDYLPVSAPANDKPRLSFVCSASYDWHGLDKLVWLAQRYPDLMFDVIGYGMGNQEGVKLPNVSIHGFMDRYQVREIVKNSDVSLGTLALHRKRMEEASPLKVREALAYGIPTVIAYKDTDLINHEFDFILRIPNDEDNVKNYAEQIRNFAFTMRGKRVVREMVAPLIDQQAKEEKRLAFFLKCSGR